MQNILLILAVLLVVPKFSETREQVNLKAFQAIFPYVNRSAVWKLTFQINKQDSVNASRKILNSWLDENWVVPEMQPVKIKTTSTTRKPALPSWEDSWATKAPESVPWKIRSLTDKEFAREQGLGFLEHRWIVKMYIRHLFRTIRDDKKFSEFKAIEMRWIFWKKDRECSNYFWCTAANFMRQTVEPIRGNMTFNQTASILKMYTGSFLKLPPVGEKLHWELQGGSMPGQEELNATALAQIKWDFNNVPEVF